MSRLFTRRRLIGAAGAVGLAPLAVSSSVNAAPRPSGPLITLLTPIRAFDSRVDRSLLGGAKLAAGRSAIITVPGFPDETRFLLAVFANVTIAETEGAGFLLVNGADSSGERPTPRTSNINWSESGQILANLVLTTVGTNPASRFSPEAREGPISSSTSRPTSRLSADGLGGSSP